jgi:hypothetical protein
MGKLHVVPRHLSAESTKLNIIISSARRFLQTQFVLSILQMHKRGFNRHWGGYRSIYGWSEYRNPLLDAATNLLYFSNMSATSVSNGSGPSLRVQVRVGTELEPIWRSGLSTYPNSRFGYGFIDISRPVSVRRVPTVLYSGSICKFI